MTRRLVLVFIAPLALAACASPRGARPTQPVPPAAAKPAGTHAETPAPVPPPSAEKQADAPPTPATKALPLDELNARWGELLAAAVGVRTGLVDYDALEKRSDKLGAFIAALQPARVFDDERQKLAFLINAYNAVVAAAVIRRHPKSLALEAGFFDRDTVTILDHKVTLDDLRDRLIRPMRDPRVHAALVAGALGSPPLRAEPYTGPRLDAQLNDQSRRLLASRRHTGVIGNAVLLSPLFRRFAADFDVRPYDGVAGFVRRFGDANPLLAALLIREPKPSIEYQDYNWALNSVGSE